MVSYRELWTATAFLLAGLGVTVTGWQNFWAAGAFWSVAVLMFGWVWRDEFWEWRQSVKRRPSWILTTADGFVAARTGRVVMGLSVHNPNRDGEFYGRVDDTRGVDLGPRPPWDLRWRSTGSRNIIGFDDRELIDVFWFIGNDPESIEILHADPGERPSGEDSTTAMLTGTLMDVAFLVSIRRANRRAVLRRWVRFAALEDTFGFEILAEGEEPT